MRSWTWTRRFGCVFAAALYVTCLLYQPADFAWAEEGAKPDALKPPEVNWDQVENIESAARRIGHVQRRQGAEAALRLIGDCYKTHSLSVAYSQGFEACIAQDYMQTRVLVQVYGRLSPDVIKKLGAPSADQLADSMGQRFANAFGKYKIPVSYAKSFKGLVDEHGWPVFLKIVFSGADAR